MGIDDLRKASAAFQKAQAAAVRFAAARHSSVDSCKYVIVCVFVFKCSGAGFLVI